MAVVYSPDSKYAQHMAQFESQHSQYGPPGRPYVYADYPLSMSKAIRPIGGGSVSFETLIVSDESEERNLASRGFCRGRDKAIAALDASEAAIAEAAANRAFNDRLMTARALREAEQADVQTAAHLPTIPEKPRRGRKPRVEVSDGI